MNGYRQSEREDSENQVVPKRKVDVRTALSLIPPASQLFGEEKRIRERRVRLRFHNELKKDVAKISPELAKEIDAKDYIEVVVAHRRRLRYKIEVDEQVPPNEVWVNGEELPELGIADNSIATVRAARSS